MKKSRFSDSRRLAILKQTEPGTPVANLCREHGMSNACFYLWRAKFVGMDASQMKQLKELEDENRQLKKMYADERLKAEMVQEGLGKKMVKPSRRKEMAQKALSAHGTSIRLACC
jgi:putative transposase